MGSHAPTFGAVSLIDEFTRSAMAFGQPTIGLFKRDFSQRHPQRHPRRFTREIRARLRFVDDHDVAGVGTRH